MASYKTTFHHKYKYGDKVWIKFGSDILQMTVVGYIYTREYDSATVYTDSIEYWLDGNTSTVCPERDIYSSREELLKEEGDKN